MGAGRMIRRRSDSHFTFEVISGLTRGQILVLVAIFLAPVVIVALVLPTYHVDIRRLSALAAEFPLLGTDRHPPLSSWLAWVNHLIPLHDAWSAVLLQALLNLGAIWFLVGIGRLFLEPARLRLAALVLLTSVLMTVWSVPGFSLNEDLAQLMTWPAAVWWYLGAIRNPMRARNWLLMGVALGLACLTKYYVLLLMAALVLASLIDRDTRRIWLARGPWLAVIVAFIVAAPHLYWLWSHPDHLEFIRQKVAPAAGGIGAISESVLAVIIAPFLLVIPGMFILAPALRPRALVQAPPPFRHFLLLVGLLVLLPLLAAFLGADFKIRYQTPVAGFVVIALLWFIPGERVARLALRVITVAGLFWAVVYLVAGAGYLFGPGHGKAQEPGPALAAELLARWDAGFSCGPGFVLGQETVSTLVAAYAPGALVAFSSLADPDMKSTQGKNAISKGGILVWKPPFGNGKTIRAAFGIKESNRITLPLRRNLAGKTATYEYSFVPPENCTPSGD